MGSKVKFTYYCVLRITIPHLNGVLSEILVGSAERLVPAVVLTNWPGWRRLSLVCCVTLGARPYGGR
jgi:hypothetical protein